MASLQEKEVDVKHSHDMEKHGGHTTGRRKSSIVDALGADMNAIEGQIYSMNDVDPALDKKMRLVNNVGAFTAHSRALLILAGYKSNRLDQLSPQAILSKRIWLHGRFPHSRYPICDCDSSSSRI